MRVSWKPVVILALPVLILLGAAWTQALLMGTHPEAGAATEVLSPHPEQQGFPLWLRLTHYVNFLFLILLARSGLQILWDHPRLYWNLNSTPGTAWLRFTPEPAPRDPNYTSMDDARYLSPWIGIPGGRHKVGLARHWHFLSVFFWLGNGVLYVALLFISGHWQRLIPTSWQIVPEAWKTFATFASFRMPVIPDAFHHYDPLQKLAYGSIVFVFAPLSLLTGAAMSPAVANRFPWYPKLFINRQVARSIHFLLLVNYVVFLVIHVTMVTLTGFTKGMNHILLGTADERRSALWLAVVALIVLVAVNYFANWFSNACPRLIQRLSGLTVGRLMGLTLDSMHPVKEHEREEISPYFWANGKLPVCEDWQKLNAAGFQGYRLRVFGLVENPLELSLADLRALGKAEHITQHDCIQGWSGVAEWGGLPMHKLFELVRPLPNARYVVFYSYGPGENGVKYYDSDPLETLRHPQTLLAYEMNYEPLSKHHGAPLRLRLENKLGFKMVKWIQAVEFVEDYRTVFKGEGGYHEDAEYYGYRANV